MTTEIIERPTEASTMALLRASDKPSFAQVRDRVRTASSGSWDRLVETGEITMEDGRLRIGAGNGTEDAGLALTPWAASQLCHRLGIPTPYFRRCPVELQDDQVNYWVRRAAAAQEADEASRRSRGQAARTRWLLRAQDDRLRAVLTERYAPLDNEVLVEHLMPLVADRFHADWFDMDDESLHLRMFDPALAREVLPGDPIMAGIHVSNSEVGKRAVTVDALVYRLVCSNGLIALVKGKSLMHRRHIGIQGVSFEKELEQAVWEATQAAGGMLERFAATVRQPVTDVEKTLDRIGLSWDLSKSTQELVRDALLRETPSQQQTLYGLINAVTHAARWLPLDDRYQLEALAGSLMQKGLDSLPAPKHKAKEVNEYE